MKTMKKILFITNFSAKEEYVDYITSFSRASYECAQELGYEFHINTNKNEIVMNNKDASIHFHVVEVYRNPFSKEVLKGYKQLAKLVSIERFDLIHCNTPIGGVLGRIVGDKYGVKHIIYQAHGFHFYSGAPKKNWLIYYPIERWLAKKTNAIITINTEDFERANRHFHLKNNGRVYYVPGVGIDLSIFRSNENSDNLLRKELKIADDEVILLSVGRLDINKNNDTVIKVLAKCKENIHYVLCGEGNERERLRKLAERLNILNRVHFLGKRTDMLEIYKSADIFILASFREGLSRAVMEAMASGLPCIVSRIRGNVDLIEDEKGGYWINTRDIEYIAKCINKLADSDVLREEMGKANAEKISEFELENVKKILSSIYREVISS